MIPNVIKIDRNVPVPKMVCRRSSRYSFLRDLDVGDSFVINGSTPDFNPKGAISSCYTYALTLRRRGGMYKNFRIACRTLEGTFKRPKEVRIWRVQ